MHTVFDREAKAALIVAHPGHELRVHGWLQLARPIVFILTDGSGYNAQSRLASSTRLLQAAGTRIGSHFGRLTDKDVYAALLRQDLTMFTSLTDTLAQAFIGEGVSYVVGDAEEGYNPTHDACRLLIDAAVALANARRGEAIGNFDFAVVGRPDQCADHLRQRAIWLHLDDEVFARKMAAARAYPELADEVAAAIATIGIDTFRVECLRPVDHHDVVVPPEQPPYYEQYGERRVASGDYREVVRYRSHLLPLSLALREWVATVRTS